MTFDDRLSHLLAEAAGAGEEPGDVFSEQGAERFMEWLERPAAYGAMSGINRYLYGVYEEREDLRRVYPDLDGSHGEAFARWAWVFGVPEMSIPARFLPPRPEGVGELVAAQAKRQERRRPELPRGPRPDLSMKVTGLMRGTLGLGEAARGYVEALEAANIPVSTSTVDVREFVQLGDVPDEGYARVDYADRDGAASAGFNLVCINADELPRLARIARRGLLPGAAHDRRLGLGDRSRPGALARGVRPAGRDLGLLQLRRREPRQGGADPRATHSPAGVALRTRVTRISTWASRAASGSCSCSTSSAPSSARTPSA